VGRRPGIGARQGRSGGRIANGAAPPRRRGARREGGRAASGAAPPQRRGARRGGGRIASGAVPPRRRGARRGGGQIASGASRPRRRGARRDGGRAASGATAPRRLGARREAGCEVDDVEWVRCFTRHCVSRPAKACLISPRPPQPQGLPRLPQWRGRQGPHGTSQGSSRTSGGRPQPQTPGAAPHTNLPRSSTPNGFPAEDLQSSTCSVATQIQRLTTYARANCPWGTAEVHFTLPPVPQGVIPPTWSNSRHRKSMQGSPGTI